MHKKSAIESIFIYAISSIVIVMILYFGYKGIAGIYEAREQNLLESAKLRINADFSQMALRYDTIGTFEYSLPSKFSELCFADLYVAEENITLRNSNIENPIIKDSIESNTQNSIFFAGETTEPFSAQKFRLSCSPFFYCFKAKAGKVSIQVTGKGNYVLLANETGFC